MGALGLRQRVGLDERSSGRDEPPARYTTTETVLLLVAGVASTDGLIHVGAAVDHFNEFPLYTLVFSLLAAVQIAWAAMIVRRPSARALLFGCAFAAGIVALWVASRTVGVPIAPRAWAPEEIGVADVAATMGEIVTVIAAASVLLSSRVPLARRVTGRIAPVLLAVLFLSVLYGVGAHAA